MTLPGDRGRARPHVRRSSPARRPRPRRTRRDCSAARIAPARRRASSWGWSSRPSRRSWPRGSSCPRAGAAPWSSSVDAESPLARLVRPRDVISAIDNEVIQSAEQAVKILNQRADHVQLVDQPRPPGQRQDRTAHGPGAVMDPVTACLRALSSGGTLSRRRGRARRRRAAGRRGLRGGRRGVPDRPADQGRDGRRAGGGRPGGPRADDPLGERRSLRSACSTRAGPAATGRARSTSRRRRRSSWRPAACRSSSTATARPRATRAARTSSRRWAWRPIRGPTCCARCLAELKIAFLFAPRFHPGLRRVAAGPASAPVPDDLQPGRPALQSRLPGVPARRRARRGPGGPAGRRPGAAGTRPPRRGRHRLRRPGRGHARRSDPRPWWSNRAWSAAKRGSPEDFGLESRSAADLRVDGPEDSAERIRRTFAGEPGPVRDYLLANTAAALWVVDQCSLREGVSRAADGHRLGSRRRLLSRWSLVVGRDRRRLIEGTALGGEPEAWAGGPRRLRSISPWGGPRSCGAGCVILCGSRNRRGLRPPDLGEDRALRRLQPARREGRVVELRYPARCLPNRGAMAPALLFRSTGLDLLRHLKVSVLARLDLSAYAAIIRIASVCRQFRSAFSDPRVRKGMRSCHSFESTCARART